MYALAYVYSTEERTKRLDFWTHPTKVHVWVNGEFAGRVLPRNAHTLNSLALTLRPGRNSILLKFQVQKGSFVRIQLGDSVRSRLVHSTQHGNWREAARMLADTSYRELWRDIRDIVRSVYSPPLLIDGRTGEYTNQLKEFYDPTIRNILLVMPYRPRALSVPNRFLTNIEPMLSANYRVTSALPRAKKESTSITHCLP